MDLREALEKAKKEKENINYYSEWENSFVFSYDIGNDTAGGDSAVVVPKNGDRCVEFLFALTNTDYLTCDVIAEGSI